MSAQRILHDDRHGGVGEFELNACAEHGDSVDGDGYVAVH